jgi:hypothetical protein
LHAETHVTGAGDLEFDLTRNFFPYFTEGLNVSVKSVQPYAVEHNPHRLVSGTPLAAGLAALATGLNDPLKRKAKVTLPTDAALTRTAARRAHVLVKFEIPV